MSETLRKYGAKYNVVFCVLCGLSSDTKPNNLFLINGKNESIANGSKFIEIDTGIVYRFDSENQQWKDGGD